MRKVLIGLAVLAAIAVVAGLLAWNSLDLIVRAAFEHWGPDLTGGKVEVREVQISPRDGRGRIAGLDIANPAGFSTPRAARFGEIRIAIDPATLTDDVIVIRELAVESAQITYERGDKSSNLDAIQKRIEAYAVASDPTGNARGAARAKKRRFVIERLSIRKTRVTMTNKGLAGQGLAFDLPDMELRDVGRRQDGVTASQAAAIVTSALQQKIALKMLTNVEALRRGGLGGALDALKGLVK
jgi:uncharacterized protein involved in outer membrane biogenesis